MGIFWLSAFIVVVATGCLAEEDGNHNRTRRSPGYDDDDGYYDDDDDDRWDDDDYAYGYDHRFSYRPVLSHSYEPVYDRRSYGYVYPERRHGYHVYPTYQRSYYRPIFEDYGDYLYSGHRYAGYDHDLYDHGYRKSGYRRHHNVWKRDTEKSEKSEDEKKRYGRGHGKRRYKLVKVPVFRHYHPSHPYYHPRYLHSMPRYSLPYFQHPQSYQPPFYGPPMRMYASSNENQYGQLYGHQGNCYDRSYRPAPLANCHYQQDGRQGPSYGTPPASQYQNDIYGQAYGTPPPQSHYQQGGRYSQTYGAPPQSNYQSNGQFGQSYAQQDRFVQSYGPSPPRTLYDQGSEGDGRYAQPLYSQSGGYGAQAQYQPQTTPYQPPPHQAHRQQFGSQQAYPPTSQGSQTHAPLQDSYEEPPPAQSGY